MVPDWLGSAAFRTAFYVLGLANTRIETDLDQVRHQAVRVWTLFKLLNVREGIGREADTVPEHWVTDPGCRPQCCKKSVGINRFTREIAYKLRVYSLFLDLT